MVVELGKITLREEYRLKVNIKMYLEIKVCESLDWILLAQSRDLWWVVVNMVINYGFHKNHIYTMTS